MGVGRSCRNPLRASVRDTRSYWSRSTETGSEKRRKGTNVIILTQTAELTSSCWDREGMGTDVPGKRGSAVNQPQIKKDADTSKSEGKLANLSTGRHNSR